MTKIIILTIDGGAHRIKTFKSLDSFKDSIIDRLENKKHFIKQIKLLKLERATNFDRYLELHFKNGYSSSIRIQKHILQ